VSSRLLLPVLLALAAARLALEHIFDPDLFWHLRLGLDMLATGQLPTTCDYTWTLAGREYLANDWLAQTVMAVLYELGGIGLIATAKALIAALIAVLSYKAALERTEGHVPAAAMAAFVSLFIVATNFATRPIMLGMACFAGVVFACERIARRPDRAALVALPLLFTVWLNVHGSWPVGLAVVGALSFSALWKERSPRVRVTPWRPGRYALLALPLALTGLLVNPVAPRLWLRPFRFVGAGRHLDAFDEGAPVPFSDPSFWILLGTVVAIGVLALFAARSKRKPAITDLALMAGAALVAFSSALYHMTFGLLVAPVLAELLAPRVSTAILANRRLNLAVAALAAALLLPIGGIRLANWEREISSRVPIEAVDALERQGLADQRGFNYFDWGGYLAFRRVPTFVDGRLEPFIDAGVFERYLELERNGDIEGVAALGARWVLVKRGTVLAESVRAAGTWQNVFANDLAELWLR
jgi:hypothetical protein